MLRLAVALVLLASPALAGEIAVSGKSQAGLYAFTAAPEEKAASVGPIHAWRLALTDAAGAPVAGARISIDGGMPGHGHGLPTAPEMVAEPEPGIYRIDGVKFSMTGDWVLRFAIEASAGADVAVAEFAVD